MQKPASLPRPSRALVIVGGILVMASAIVLAQWASGQPSTLSLAPVGAQPARLPMAMPSAEPAATAPRAEAASLQNQNVDATAAQSTPRYASVPAQTPPATTAPAIVGASTAAMPNAGAVTNSAVTPASTASTAAMAARQPLELRNLSADALRTQLEEVLKRPIPARADATGEWQVFSLGSTPESAVMVAINGRTREVRLDGTSEQIASWRSVIEGMDAPPLPAGITTRVVATQPEKQPIIRRAFDGLQTSGISVPGTAATLATLLYQGGQPAGGAPAGAAGQPAGGVPAAGGQPETPVVASAQTPPAQSALAQLGALLGPVQIQFIEGANIVIIRGREQDVQQVLKIIERIEEITKETTPEVRVHQLLHVDSISMAALLVRVYDTMFLARLGPLNVTPLAKPNALLLVGSKANVDTAIEKIISQLDKPVAPQAQFEVFRLKYIPAASAKTTVDSFLVQPAPGPAVQAPDTGPAVAGQYLPPRAIVVSEPQSNSLIVVATQTDIARVADLIRQIDADPEKPIEVKIIPLRNALATDLATTLQTALAPPTDLNAVATTTGNLRVETEIQGQRMRAGGLIGVLITADVTTNSLVVKAPRETIPLLEQLIRQLDVPAQFSASLKVFPLVNAQADVLAATLQTMFAPAAAGATGAPQGGLVPLAMTADPRTNSIIAVGALRDLATVEAILTTLDRADIRSRKTTVYRLQHAFATDVANALTTTYNAELTIINTIGLSVYEIYDQSVTVVAEPVSNNLIISATPKHYDNVIKVIQDIDRRPPMVMIQVLIAAVQLSDRDEFGVELGIQDSILFDRSGTGAPGFNFGNPAIPLGNTINADTLATAGSVAAQGLSHFGLGRTSDAGFGGLVFSANSESVTFLLRALQQKQRVEILSRPQIQTLDAQPALIFVGQTVSFVTGTSVTALGQTVNAVSQIPVGLLLNVVPLIGPDGVVVMQVIVQNRALGDESTTVAEGVQVPVIDETTAQTTVTARSGQTIVLSGLLQTRKLDLHRRVPLVAEIPLIGDLFRFDRVDEERRELLIVLTPQVVYHEGDNERIKAVESSRMSYILRDVISLHGPSGLRSRCDDWYGSEADIVYDGRVPAEGELMPMHEGMMMHEGQVLPHEGGESLPTPQSQPQLSQPPGVQPPTLPPTLPPQLPPPGTLPGTQPRGGQTPMLQQPSSQQPGLLPPGVEMMPDPQRPAVLPLLPPQPREPSTSSRYQQSPTEVAAAAHTSGDQEAPQRLPAPR